jgi:hypothetical protein
MLECWAFNGLVARMILPLGLNVRSAELSLKSVMLPPPSDALEREERRAAMWFAFYHDTVSVVEVFLDTCGPDVPQISSSASGWGTSIQLDELVSDPGMSSSFVLLGSDGASACCGGSVRERDGDDGTQPSRSRFVRSVHKVMLPHSSVVLAELTVFRHPVPDPFVMLLKGKYPPGRTRRTKLTSDQPLSS